MQEPAQELATIEPKNLAELLVIDEQLPADFFTSTIYDQRLDQAIAATTGLVYELDADGEKAAKADATSINKFATLYDKFIAAAYKAETEQVGKWRDAKKAKTKQLLANRQALIDQFAEKRAAKLIEIREKLTACLLECWEAEGVKPDFRNGDIADWVKLNGTLTSKGALTNAALKFCQAIAVNNLAWQTKIEGRHLILENRCLRADINPPLTHVHFGAVFYADDQFFDDKLEELIAAEIERRAEMEARIIQQQEAQKQKEIDAALKAQQAEANRLAKEKADNEQAAEAQRLRTEVIEPALEQAKAIVTHQQVDNATADLRKREDDRKNPPVQPAATIPGKRLARFTVTFEVSVSERISDLAVEKHFLSKLPDELKAMIAAITFG